MESENPGSLRPAAPVLSSVWASGCLSVHKGLSPTVHSDGWLIHQSECHEAFEGASHAFEGQSEGLRTRSAASLRLTRTGCMAVSVPAY